MLKFLNAKKAYAHDSIFEIPFLELDAGVYWLQGSNGSGKTTLLRMIAGICGLCMLPDVVNLL